MAQEEERRAEQVLRAHRRKEEQERLLFAEQARRAEVAQQRAELAVREMRAHEQAERVTEERLQGERAAYLERVRAELELEATLTVMKTAQQQELERLALLRDARVRTLEGQRGLLGAFLLTLIIGIGLIYAVILRPDNTRLATALVDSRRANDESRQEQGKEREAHDRRIAELSSQLGEQTRVVEGLRKELLAAKAEPRPGSGQGRTTMPPPPPPPKTVCKCDKADPLCDCW
jgi:hypothetical protein